MFCFSRLSLASGLLRVTSLYPVNDFLPTVTRPAAHIQRLWLVPSYEVPVMHVQEFSYEKLGFGRGLGFLAFIFKIVNIKNKI